MTPPPGVLWGVHGIPYSWNAQCKACPQDSLLEGLCCHSRFLQLIEGKAFLLYCSGGKETFRGLNSCHSPPLPQGSGSNLSVWGGWVKEEAHGGSVPPRLWEHPGLRTPWFSIRSKAKILLSSLPYLGVLGHFPMISRKLKEILYFVNMGFKCWGKENHSYLNMRQYLP